MFGFCARRKHKPVQLWTVELAPGVLEEHRTQRFVDSSYYYPHIRNPSVVLRRGASVRLTVTCADSSTPTLLTACLHDLLDTTAYQIVFQPAKSKGVVNDMRCFTESAQLGHAIVHFRLPANMPVGEYYLSVAPHGRPDFGVAIQRAIVLFNPWCEQADEHMPDEKARYEYILLESGYIFNGTWQHPGCIGWHYAQFEPGVLAAVRRMLAGMRASERASPVTLARKFSALCNAPDDNGVLVGNWSSDFSGGVAPMNWRGSLQILSSWGMNGLPVKYGQCWVFAGVLTSAMRCVGLAARPVTNYQSAHDTDANRMVEEYFTFDGAKTNDSKDSIWNFHVWTEAYMARPDLPQKSFGGWQAIDATPQEKSEGVFQCGPASVAAVKLGLQLSFDNDFIIGEVNADIRRYLVMYNQPPRLIQVDTRDVGRMILTKALGSWDQRGENIVDRYKAPEGSLLERASLLRLENGPSLAGSLELKISDAKVGSLLSVRLTLLRLWEGAFPRGVTLSIRALASEYTGRGRTLLGNISSTLDASVAEERGITLELPTTSYHFSSLLTGSFCPVLIVGVASWVDHTENNSMLIVQEGIELEVPGIELKSVEPPAQVLRKSVATLSFRNPFNNWPLTGVQLLAEGPHLLEPQSFPLTDVPPAAEASATIEFIPRLRYAGSYMLITTLVSNELTGMVGKHVVQVSGGWSWGMPVATE